MSVKLVRTKISFTTLISLAIKLPLSARRIKNAWAITVRVLAKTVSSVLLIGKHVLKIDALTNVHYGNAPPANMVNVHTKSPVANALMTLIAKKILGVVLGSNASIFAKSKHVDTKKPAKKECVTLIDHDFITNFQD